MSWFAQFGSRIRRRDTPLTDWLYRTLKAAYRMQSPVIPVLHPTLYWARELRHELWERLTKGLYYEPMFRTRCEAVGPGLTIGNYGGNGMPCVNGDLRLYLGKNVHLADRTTFAGARYSRTPRCGLVTTPRSARAFPSMWAKKSPSVRTVSSELQLIADNPGHPMLDVIARINNEPFHASEARPVSIGDFVWIPPHSTYVLPGSKIGDGCILLPDTKVAGMVIPPFCLVGGNPAQILAKLPLPKALQDLVGEDRYKQYREESIRP
ncbi:MAG: hypothetical protein R2748_31185 [Bryobacterales bacterium]